MASLTLFERKDEFLTFMAEYNANGSNIIESKIGRVATAQSIPNNTTTTLTFDTEVNDPLNIWDSANPNNIVVPGSGNKVLRLYTQVTFAASASGYRQVQVAQNRTVLAP